MRVAALVAAILLVAGCGGSGEQSKSTSGKMRVTATTGMVAELARRVGGDRVEVENLMGPGVDPHLYKASEGDIGRLAGADLIFYNGLNLEGKMGEIFVKMARRGKPTYAVTESVDPERLREPPEFLGHYDPHAWFDISLWSQTIATVVEAMSEADPSASEYFEANGAAYAEELKALHEYCKERIATIPKERRVLVTAHDAFGYFGRAYDIDVVGLQGISTASEYGLKDVKRIIDIITERRLKAVFIESSVPRRSIEAVVAGCRSRGHEVVIGGQLFSDAMGEAGTPEGTYPGMVRHNVETIVGALK
ncbi:MAG: metal ABC transporter solute-binding protein, Zn/Mn family [Candidatus Krumholzibacteriia bacterium]